jgi:outer membrane protein X
MKKLFLLFVFLGLAIMLKAQTTTSTTSATTYKSFKVDLGFGYAIPTANSGGGTKAGATFTIQPHYRLSDDLALGLRLEGAGLGYVNENSSDTKAKVSLLISYCATAEYYLADGGVRPFVGAGVGFFTQSSITADSESENNTGQLVAGGTKAGFFPEVGLEAGHFRLSADYDVVGNNNNYFAFKVGFFFGGGKK